MIQLDRFRNDDFDRGASRFKECAWVVTKALVFLTPFPLPSRLRVAVLRLFGAKVGCNVVIRSGVDISFPWRLTIGDHSWIGQDAAILSLEKVSIGANCCISQRAFICTGSHDFSLESFDLITKPISIDEGAWIAASSFVAPGVTFGRGSMCAAGSVVVKDVSPETVVGGNPARVIRDLAAN